MNADFYIMKRRYFVKALGALSLAPALPAKALTMSAGAAPVSYTRYMYGLGVFHVRTKASITAAELGKSLALNPAQTEAMLGEMMRSNVISSTATKGTVRAVSSHMKPQLSTKIKHMAKDIGAQIDEFAQNQTADIFGNEVDEDYHDESADDDLSNHDKLLTKPRNAFDMETR